MDRLVADAGPAPAVTEPSPAAIRRARLVIRGAVQGVGFRPFVHRLATGLCLDGWVQNGSHGVVIEVEGPPAATDDFVRRVERDRPPRAFIQSLEQTHLDPAGVHGFEIRDSTDAGPITTLVLPDVATCADCTREVFDPANRRYRYPFTNCTNCGPRYTIIERMPYDRASTSMRAFTMCPDCQREYDDPADRRFHAQPNACPTCGPQLTLWDLAGCAVARADMALRAAADAIRHGHCVAVKGLGGFHLMVDARSALAVARLRERKHREEKPFALMFPTLEAIEAECELSPPEVRLLQSSESPIVLVRKRAGLSDLAPGVAPGNPTLGVMRPYTPLHQLLMADLGFPVVATSGNVSDEPICIDPFEALDRLGGLADLFLVHDRPIVRHVDDSIVRVMLGRELVLRRARGFAPLPVLLDRPAPPLLAVGGHLKSAIAVTAGRNAFISQHIGDLQTAEAYEAFERTISSFEHLFGTAPERVVHDRHPDYVSTRYARGRGVPVLAVQHHHAHVAACMAENALTGPVLGVSWDGTGYGPDGTVWGGEFLRVDRKGFVRVATFRSFRLPGGDRAVTEPRRTALGLLYELEGSKVEQMTDIPSVAAFAPGDRRVLLQALGADLNAPRTTSAGRLFDAVASLVGIRHVNSYEGQAAMELEFAVDAGEPAGYPLDVVERPSPSACADDAPMLLQIDWGSTVRALLVDIARQVPIGRMAARFHNAMVEAIVEIARRIGEPRLVLTGGCFQNRYLTERAVARLVAEGCRPYWHQRIPPNDGGIALGQIIAALGRME